MSDVGAQLSTFADGDIPFRIAFSPDSRYVAFGNLSTRLYEVETGKQQMTTGYQDNRWVDAKHWLYQENYTTNARQKGLHLVTLP
jgi:hypothetical protein